MPLCSCCTGAVGALSFKAALRAFCESSALCWHTASVSCAAKVEAKIAR